MGDLGGRALLAGCPWPDCPGLTGLWMWIGQLMSQVLSALVPPALKGPVVSCQPPPESLLSQVALNHPHSHGHQVQVAVLLPAVTDLYLGNHLRCLHGPCPVGMPVGLTLSGWDRMLHRSGENGPSYNHKTYCLLSPEHLPSANISWQ